MNSPTGNKESLSRNEFRLGPKVKQSHPFVGSPMIHEGAIPDGVPYRVINNITGTEEVLTGAKILEHVKAFCKSLTYWTVLARFTFIRA